jgi:hypothetical protein
MHGGTTLYREVGPPGVSLNSFRSSDQPLLSLSNHCWVEWGTSSGCMLNPVQKSFHAGLNEPARIP